MHLRPGITLEAFYQTPGALRQGKPQRKAADIFSLMRLTSFKDDEIIPTSIELSSARARV
jgi:hypothetical protein